MTLPNYKKNFTVIILLFVGLLSCEKKLEFDDDVKRSKLVINSVFTPDSLWRVHVSNSLSVVDPAALQIVENAEVTIRTNANIIETLNYAGNGYYVGNGNMPVEGVRYDIIVTANDYETASGTSYIPGNYLTGTITDTTYIAGEYTDSRTLQLEISIEDIGEEQNAIELYKYGISVLGEYIDSLTGNHYFNQVHLSSNDIIFGEQNGTYGETLLFNNNLFDENTYNLKLNVHNIDGYSTWELDSTGVYVEVLAEHPIGLTIQLKVFSYDLYKYYKSIDRYHLNQGDPFAQPVQVFSNIRNGLGIVGGFNTNKIELELQ